MIKNYYKMSLQNMKKMHLLSLAFFCNSKQAILYSLIMIFVMNIDYRDLCTAFRTFILITSKRLNKYEFL